MAIMVRVEMDRMGNIIARPISDRWAKRFARVVKDNGGPDLARDNFTAFFQEGMGATEFVELDLPARYRKDLEAGWPVRFKVDPWVVGMWYGYDAHTAAE